MAHVISDACLACGACADACPVSAIKEGDTKYEINADECIECGACEERCPYNLPIRQMLKEVATKFGE